MSGEFFREDGWTDHHAFIPEGVYGQVLDSIVFGCTDVSLVNDVGDISVIRRIRSPQTGFWSIGGRMVPGASPEENAAHNLKRETTLDILPERFRYVGTYSTCWATRAQEPKTNGCHGLIMHFALSVSAKEIEAIKLDGEEYDTNFSFFSPTEIRSRVKRGDLHPIFLNILADLGRSRSNTRD